MFEKVETKWTEDSGDYNDITQKQLRDKKTVAYWTRELKSLLGTQPLRILEVGCGPGFMSILMARLGHDVKAVDGAIGMVEKAKENMRKQNVQVEVCEEDAVTLPEEEAGTPEQAFCRWKEVLKPGGKIIYFDGDYQTMKPTLKNKLWVKVSDVLIYLTEKKKYDSDVKESSGVYEGLPMITEKRPEKDFEILKRVRFARIQIRGNRWLNRPWSLDFWKYGYLGKKFIVVATKKGQEK